MEWPPRGVLDVDAASMRATAFLGREDDLARLSSLLADHPLVSLTGPGGVGKTRLALEVAARLRQRFTNGVAWMTFTGIEDASLVPSTASTALQVVLGKNETLTDALTTGLRTQHRLLVLDNCEHVLDGAAALCIAITARCPDVRILITSRERLGVPCEALHPVRPLPVPGQDEPAENSWEQPSVRMFNDRLLLVQRARDPGRTAEDRRRVCNIVRSLDGLPLAIELAAAHLDALDLADLEERLTQESSIGPRAGAPETPMTRLGERHATLDACVRWSYEHLNPDEQHAFTRLALFPGRFSLAAARAAGVAAPFVTSLVRKSLVTPPDRDVDGTPRYSMLRTVRAVAARLRFLHEGDVVWARLAGWYANETERIAIGLNSSTTELASLAWIDAEHDNLRAVLAWAEMHNGVVALRLAVATAHWSLIRGRYAEATTLLVRLSAALRARGPVDTDLGRLQALTAAAATWRSWFALYLSDFEECKRLHDEVVTSRGVDPERVVDSFNCVAGAHLNTGEYAAAEAAAHAARKMAAGIHYRSGETFACVVLCVARLYRDDSPGALGWARGAMLQNSAEITGWVDRWRLTVLADALAEAGDEDGAAKVWNELVERGASVGNAHVSASAAVRLGYLEVRAGRATGRDHLRLALHGFNSLHDELMLADVLQATTYYGLGVGHPNAPALIGAREAIMRRIGAPDNAIDLRLRNELLHRSTERYGAERLNSEIVRGESLDTDQAVDLADEILAFDAPDCAVGTRSGLLSPRERELLRLVAAGRTDAQIAAELYISIRTVRSHLDRIAGKTGYRRRADLTRLALQSP